MRQRLILNGRPTLVSQNDCDYGVEPRPETCRFVDLVMDGEGKLHPAITLRRGDNCRLILFKEGLYSRDLNGTSGGFRQWQRKVRVSFLQQDPSCPEVYVIIQYRGHVLEQVAMIQELQPFIDFPFEDGVAEPEDVSDEFPQDDLDLTA